ncbi:MAG: DUF423 domain-containing protein [Gammaproteobacteria bacterium]|nr:DUF423 domain-containing protein [Gammaproteobacteria bacterium]
MIFSKTSRGLIMLGAISGFLSIILGAFGAHAIKQWLAPDLMSVYQTAVSYQIYHSLGLLLLGLIYHHHQNSLIRAAGWLMISGTVIFSGSLYILALADIRWLGAVTPVGGSFLILSWLLLAIGIRKQAS